MGMPAKIASSMAGSPCFVPGILISKFVLPALAKSSFAAARVRAVSYARRGETSSETQPSTPLVRSWTGRNRSAARVRSSSARSKNSASPRLALPKLCTAIFERRSPRHVLDRVIENSGIRSQSGYRKFVDVSFERSAIEQSARDVIEPDALSQIVKQLRCFHLSAPFSDCGAAAAVPKTL